MKTLSIHTLTHVPFEGLGCIEQWIINHHHKLSFTRLYKKHRFPEMTEIDWLIIMGGPMGVDDEAAYPWLVEEKSFIRSAIQHGKTVIGICLGSQLIAGVLGAKVYPDHQKEIGWYDVKLTEVAIKHPLFKNFDAKFTVFHWHGDTFDIPDGSIHFISSETCANQAFLFNEKVLGLQFHFEVTGQTLKEMIVNGKEELIENTTIQPAEQILVQTGFIESNNLKMFQILDYFENISSMKS
jgi:GMP synthase-like glutamine amidotransferase